jgi:hypothetical protein
VQNAISSDVVIGFGHPTPDTPNIRVPNSAAWARPLAQSPSELMPDRGDDDPVLDADLGGP